MTKESNLTVKIASTAQEVDAVFRGRHRVFVETDRYMKPSSDARLHDRFDCYPTSANVIAMHEGSVVGGMRLTIPSAVGTSSEEMFDFRKVFPALTNDYITASWFFLERHFRSISRAAYGIAALAYAWSQSKGRDRLFCVINPDVAQSALRIGFAKLAEPIYDDKKQLTFVPMMLEFSTLSAEMRMVMNRIVAEGKVMLDGLDVTLVERRGDVTVHEGFSNDVAV